MPEASLIITNSGSPGTTPDPDFIEHGELALNWADNVLYFKDVNNNVQSITTQGGNPLILSAIPENEGPWTEYDYPTIVPNTAFVPVAATVAGATIKIILITTGENSIVVDGTDVTVSVLAGLTATELATYINSDEDAKEVIRFINAPGSDGTGIISPDPVETAPTITANAASGDRAAYIDQSAIVAHSDSTFSEWSAATIEPTEWIPKSPNLLYNRTVGQWERMFVEDGSVQTEILPL